MAASILLPMYKIYTDKSEWGWRGIVDPDIFGGGGVVPPVTVPKVIGSTIYANNHGRILVEWDTEMKGTADIRFAISIIVNGGAPIVPNAVTFAGKFMTLSDHFHAGDVISWAYDDQNASELLSTKVGNIEADNQTYGVTNNIIAASLPQPAPGSVDSSADVPGVPITGTFVDFIVQQGNNTDNTERGYKDPSTGASTGPFGSINKTLIETGAEVFGVYCRIYPRPNNKVSLDLEVVLKANDPTISKIWMSIDGEMFPMLHYPPASYVVNSEEGFNNFNAKDPEARFGLRVERTTPPPPDPNDPGLDLDGDGLPDTIVYDEDGILITEDADSIDIDLDGDGIADISIPK